MAAERAIQALPPGGPHDLIAGVNLFVLCTGRCGSLAFARACGHMTNFSAAHESRVPRLGDDRLAYPPRHIEVDNRLSWFLGRLDRTYGNDAYYVHLSRDPERVAHSWSRRFGVLGGIMPAYRDNILAGASSDYRIGRAEAAVDYVRTVTENIDLFLKDKDKVMRLRVEEIADGFPRFWKWIGAVGDLDGAMAEWSTVHDTEAVRLGAEQRVRDFGKRTRRLFFPPR